MRVVARQEFYCILEDGIWRQNHAIYTSGRFAIFVWWYAIGPYTGLKSRPRPGPQTWFEAQAQPGPAAVVQTWPGPARKLNYEARARPGPQQLCPGPARPAKQFHIWGPGPAGAHGPRAGPLARPHRPTKQQNYYCVHILMWLLSCYVHNHMYSISNVCLKASMD